MKTFMLWTVVCIGFTIGFTFGSPDMRGTLVMFACFVALGAVAHALTRKRKEP